MPGSATMNPDILVDDLAELVDDLREDLNTEFGTRAYLLFTVSRVWESGTVGMGEFVEIETPIKPDPLVEPFIDNLGYELQPCGLDEAGFVRVREISITYLQEELTGKPVVDGIETDTPEGEQWTLRIREAHGQNQSYKDFKIQGTPYPDRLPKHFGWELKLIKSEEYP